MINFNHDKQNAAQDREENRELQRLQNMTIEAVDGGGGGDATVVPERAPAADGLCMVAEAEGWQWSLML